MSQQDFLRALDSDISGAFAGVGMADTATYTPTSGAAVADCTVLVDRGATLVGSDSQVITNQIMVTAFLAQISAKPRRGATFTLDGTAEVFTVDDIADADESRVRCLCKVGT